MSSKITTLFEDEAKTNALYPRTKASAVSDDNGNTLGNIATYGFTPVASGADPVKVGIDMDLLWTNSSPTSNFAAQTVALDLTEYSMVVVVFKFTTTLSYYGMAIGVINGLTYVGSIIQYDSDDQVRREFTPSGSGVTFTDGRNKTGVNNTYCVPVYIYGVR